MAAPLTPFVWAVATVVLLGWTLVSLQPHSPLRPPMLSLILAAASVTALTASSAGTSTPSDIFLGAYFGVLIILEAIDHVCLSRLYYHHTKKSSEDGLLIVVPWIADSIFNKRKIGTPQQVKNVPHFDSRRPDYVPTRERFLLYRTIRLVLTYLFLDLLTSMPGPDLQEQFNDRKVAFLGRMVAGQITVDEFVERAILTAFYWFLCYFVQLAAYDFFSIAAVGSLLSSPADWPPRFGSVFEAYTIRQFWGIFWHQELRQSLTSNSSVIVHQILQIPKGSLVGRYAKLFFAFFLSGLIHSTVDRLWLTPPGESSALYFFSVQAIGIVVEDAVQHVLRNSAVNNGSAAGSRHDNRPSIWRKLVGFVWVALFLTLQTPHWSYPMLRTGIPLRLPVRFIQGFV